MINQKTKHGGPRDGAGRPTNGSQAATSNLFARITPALKARITRAHNAREMKESPWLVEAIEEKLIREKF